MLGISMEESKKEIQSLSAKPITIYRGFQNNCLMRMKVFIILGLIMYVDIYSLFC